jgi:chromosome segregation ATPase
MAASYNFRSAFNGFNREDVVHYIEYINSKHSAQINQLRSDLAAARQETADLRATPPRDPAMEDRIAQLTAKVAQLEEELLLAQLAQTDAETARDSMKQQRDEAIAAQSEAKRHSEAELEAYRRAERMERQAKERADAMYTRANGIVADATSKVDEAAQQINGIADHVASQLAVLQSAVIDSKQALQEAAAALYTIQT